MFPRLDAAVGRLGDKSAYFSLPFNSTILTVIGKRDLNAIAAALSYRVAIKVLFPILSFILLPVGFVLLLLSAGEVLLLQDAQLISDTARKASRKKCFIIPVLNDANNYCLLAGSAIKTLLLIVFCICYRLQPLNNAFLCIYVDGDVNETAVW